MSAAEHMQNGEPRAEAPREPLVPVRDKLLLDDAETAALLGIKPGSIANLESREPDFPRPVVLSLDRKLRRRTDIESWVAKLKQRRT